MKTVSVEFNRDKTNKLVISAIKYTDALFKKIEKHCTDMYKKANSYEEFLNLTPDYTIRNPLIVEGFSDMTNEVLLKSISDISFSKPAQKALIREIIENNVAELVTNAGDDLKEHIKEVTLDAYDNNIAPQDYWKNLQAPPLVKGKNGAKRTVSVKQRCKMISRTETARTQNIANYIVGKERSATHWYALGFTDEKTCAECIEKYGTPTDPVYYEIEDTTYLPPLHPNCRHAAVFIQKETDDDFETTSSEEFVETEEIKEGSGSIVQSEPISPKDEEEIPKSKIDTKYFEESGNGKGYAGYEDELPVGYSIVNKDGKTYLNGLEIYYEDSDGYISFSIDDVNEHNDSLKKKTETEDVDSVEYKEKFEIFDYDEDGEPIYDKPIEISDLEYDDGEKAYIIPEDKIQHIDYVGSFYNGQQVYYNGNKGPFIKKFHISKHNKNLGYDETGDHKYSVSDAYSDYVEGAGPGIKKEVIDINKMDFLSDEQAYYAPEHEIQIGDNGKPYYNGLEVKYDGFGYYVSAQDIYKHNYDLGSNMLPLIISKEPIDCNFFEFDADYDGYAIPSDHLIQYDGKQYFNGLEVEFIPDGPYGFGILKYDEIQAHNSNLGKPIPKMTPIDTDVLTYNKNTDNYLIDGLFNKVDIIDGVPFFNGLEVQEYNGLYKISKKKLDEHNEFFGIDPNPNHIYAKDVEQTKESMGLSEEYNGRLKSMETEINEYHNDDLTPIILNDELYLEDKDGRRWIVDVDEKYQRLQDSFQDQVYFNSELRSSGTDWGDYGHHMISNMLYGDSKHSDWWMYKDKVDNVIRPKLDEILELKTELFDNGKDFSDDRKVKKLKKELLDYVRDKINNADVYNTVERIIDLDEIILISPRLSQDTAFVRQGHFDESLCEKGKKISFEGFLATSYEGPIGPPSATNHFAQKPGRWEITILTPTGAKGTRLNHTFSAAEWEREWLLRRDEDLEVINYDLNSRPKKVTVKVCE